MNINADEALRAKDLAAGLMEQNNFPSALKLASKARKLDPNLDKISQMILVCEVHCAAETMFGKHKDWYGILQVDENASESTVKKQYKKLALEIHPDKNKFPGASDAFKLVGEAHTLILDRHKRLDYDNTRRRWKLFGTTPPYQPPAAPAGPPAPTAPAPEWRPYHTQPPTASDTAKNTRKRKRFVVDSSSSSDSDSSSDRQEADFMILSDDDVQEEKQTQEEKEEKQTQEEKEEKQPQEEKEEKQSQEEQEGKQPQEEKEEKQPLEEQEESSRRRSKRKSSRRRSKMKNSRRRSKRKNSRRRMIAQLIKFSMMLLISVTSIS